MFVSRKRRRSELGRPVNRRDFSATDQAETELDFSTDPIDDAAGERPGRRRRCRRAAGRLEAVRHPQQAHRGGQLDDLKVAHRFSIPKIHLWYCSAE